MPRRSSRANDLLALCSIYCAASPVCSTKQSKQLVQHNPALKPGKILKTKGKAEDINPFTREEEALFLKGVEKRALRYYPFFLFLLRTGCRLGEAIVGHLAGATFALNGRFIQIRRNLPMAG